MRELNPDRQNRLDALKIDNKTREILRECKPIIEEMIDRAIRDSFDKIFSFPGVRDVYSGIKIEDAYKSQKKHWLEDILSATFSEQQIKNCIDLFAIRQKQGVLLRYYFCFYTNMVCLMIEAINAHYKRKREKIHESVDALTRVVMFEIEIASAAYMHSAQEQVSIVMNSTADQFEQQVSGVVSQVSASVSQLSGASSVMADVAQQAAQQSASAANTAVRTSDNIRTVATATDQLTSSIQEISTQVGKVAQMTDLAVEDAQRTNRLVQGLAEAVSRIGDVVRLINDIAAQTNLLALNATIEAARAGDAGKGFAVVANEVKSLANQTGRATDEISAQISAVQSATRDAVTAIQGVGGTIVNINEIATAVAGAVEEQRAATREIARNVDEAAEGGAQVSQTVAAVNDLAGKTDTTARDLSATVTLLSTQADVLSTQVGEFTRKIRSAS